jgi:hypothetical protein
VGEEMELQWELQVNTYDFPDSLAYYWSTAILSPDLTNGFSAQRSLPLTINLDYLHKDGDIVTTPTNMATLSFGDVLYNTTQYDSIKVENSGEGMLTIDSLEITNTDYTLVNPLNTPYQIHTNQYIWLKLAFTPSDTGSAEGVCKIWSNDPEQNLTTVNLSGTGIAPAIAAGEDILDFGRIEAGTSETLNFTITNTGTADLTISAFDFVEENRSKTVVSKSKSKDSKSKIKRPSRFKNSVGVQPGRSGDSFTTPQITPVTLTPDEQLIVSITFHPQLDEDLVTETLHITSDAINETDLQIDLTGFSIESPVVNIPDNRTLPEDTPTTVFATLDSFFVDQDGQDMVWSVIAFDNTVLDSVIIEGVSSVKIYPKANLYGNTWTKFNAIDPDGLTDTDSVSITVTPVNDAPQFTSDPITAATEDEIYTYEITADDVDESDMLTIEAVEIPTWLSINAFRTSKPSRFSKPGRSSGATETLSGTPENADVGIHDIILKVTDAVGDTALQQFTITVENVDDAPEVAIPLSDLTVNEDAPDSTIDLTDTFTDIDNDDGDIAKTVLSNSNPALVNTTLDGNDLILGFLEDQNGNAEIVIEATSNEKTVTDTFSVTVNPVNDPPNEFNRLSPDDYSEVEENPVNFLWTKSEDIEGDSLIYSLSVSIANHDTIYYAIPDTVFTVDFTFFELEEDENDVTWFVTASDGQDSTMTDMNYFTLILIQLIGDANRDGKVDINDLQGVTARINSFFGDGTGKFDQDFDIIEDGVINMADVKELINHWGESKE